MAGHFFTTARGKAIRDSVLRRDDYTCQMCGADLRPGKRHKHSAVVDHTRPVSLRPDLQEDRDNMRAVCRTCHAVCDSIEKRANGDEARVAREKAAYRPVGRDGYPVNLK